MDHIVNLIIKINNNFAQVSLIHIVIISKITYFNKIVMHKKREKFLPFSSFVFLTTTKFSTN